MKQQEQTRFYAIDVWKYAVRRNEWSEAGLCEKTHRAAEDHARSKLLLLFIQVMLERFPDVPEV